MRKQTKLVAVLSAAALLALGASMTSFAAGWEKDEDGRMKSGWQDVNGNVYYLGDEDDGARTENQWLWLEKSGLIDNDDDEDDLTGIPVRGCSDDEDNDYCDDEGWYWFQSNGKIYNEKGKKKINGKYYMFNNHGQMLYEWINNDTTRTLGSKAQLDGNAATKAAISDMIYYDVLEDGSRVNGWRQIDGSQDVGQDNNYDWYFFDDGDAEHATDEDFTGAYDEDGAEIYRARIKCDGKYFCFDQNGRMKKGLNYIEANTAFYYFGDNGAMVTGKVSDVECDDDDYTFYFEKKNGKNGQGITGEKDGYLYYNGKRLEADDDNRLFYVDGDIYLVNTKGKIQKAKTGKKFDMSYVKKDTIVSVPFICLYNDNVNSIFTYNVEDNETNASTGVKIPSQWYDFN